MIAYEIGYRSQIVSRWSVDLTAFLTQQKGLLVPQRRAPTAVSTPVPHLSIVQQDINGADTESHGAEVSSTLMAATHWRLTGSYSWLASRVVFAEPNTVLTGSFYGGARHQGQLHSYVDIKPGLQLNASLYGVASSHSGVIPAYTRFDAAAVWQATERLGLQLGIQSALDSRHSEFQVRTGPQPEIGRAVYAQLTVR